MGKKIESWQSDDGCLFKSERDMLMHELRTSLIEEFPDLKVCQTAILQHSDRIAELFAPLLYLNQRDHPEAAETTLPLPFETLPKSENPKWDGCGPAEILAEAIMCRCGADDPLGRSGEHEKTCPVERARHRSPGVAFPNYVTESWSDPANPDNERDG